jgi:arylsulfatase A-like enzyme
LLVAVCALPVAVLVDAYRWPSDGAVIEPGLFPLDPGVVQHTAAFEVDFTGNGRGLVKLGSGWQQPRPRSRWWRWPKLRAVGPRAQLFVAGPWPDPSELVLEIEPFPQLDGEQSLETWLDGALVDRRILRPGLEIERIALLPKGLSAGIHTVELRFARAVVPAEVGVGTERRTSAARIGTVRLEPRNAGVPGVTTLLDRSRLALGGESTLDLPLPAGAIAVELAGGVGGDGLVVAEVLHGGRLERLAEGPPEEVLAATWSFGEALAQPAWLRLRSRDLVEQTVEVEVVRGEQPSRETPPNVLLLTIDTLRADALTVYGATRETSPHFARLAESAVVFEHAWSTAPWTAPATKSIHTGLWPEHHGHVRVGSLEVEPPQFPLAERLGAAGYDTFAIVQNPVVGPIYGFDRGFGRIYRTDTLLRSASESAEVPWFLLHHLASRPNPQRPWFASVHIVDPHESYLPQGEDRRFARERIGLLRPWQYQPGYFQEHGLNDNRREVKVLRGLYDGEVRRADRQFGRLRDLLEYLDEWEDTLVIVTSDHGEEFGEHGVFGHSFTLYEELLHVPLIVRFPGGRDGGLRVSQRASVVDVAPTVAEVVGLEEIPLDGVSLARPRELPEQRVVLAETRPHWDLDDPRSVALQAVARGSIKCIRSLSGSEGPGLEIPEWRVYDLARDPDERHPLAPDSTDAQACRSWLEQAFPATIAASRRGALSAEQEAELRALGYL